MMTRVEKFVAWVDWIRDEHDEFSYRYVYSAFLAASGGFERPVGHATMKVLPDGGYLLRAGGEVELHLAGDGEREAFVAYLVARYCQDKYPDMATWEAQQHAWFKEDRW
jgi:hypothetical protein